jgi:hypothetical protein
MTQLRIMPTWTPGGHGWVVLPFRCDPFVRNGKTTLRGIFQEFPAPRNERVVGIAAKFQTTLPADRVQRPVGLSLVGIQQYILKNTPVIDPGAASRNNGFQGWQYIYRQQPFVANRPFVDGSGPGSKELQVIY